VVEILSLGYPAEKPTKFKRSLNSIMHKEMFETHKLRTNEEIKHLLKIRKSADILLSIKPLLGAHWDIKAHHSLAIEGKMKII
ncbi:MAG: hypothetical protein ACK4TI_00060, partial [Nitrososphaerales archaeon]